MADKYIYAVARIRALEMTLMSQAVIEQLVATDSYKKAVQRDFLTAPAAHSHLQEQSHIDSYPNDLQYRLM